MKQWLLPVFLYLALFRIGLAEDLSRSFPLGAGSRFKIESQGISGDLVISVASQSSKSVNIEYYFSSANPFPVQMWQQFQMESTAGGMVKIVAGYLLSPQMKKPERVDAEHIRGFDGIDLNAFLFPNAETLKRFKVAEESITVPAGRLRATHYRQKQGNQTFDYWISDAASPIGLVKLNSSGGPSGEFHVSLGALVKNVAPKIIPTEAGPLTQLGMDMLPSLQTKP